MSLTEFITLRLNKQTLVFHKCKIVLERVSNVPVVLAVESHHNVMNKLSQFIHKLQYYSLLCFSWVVGSERHLLVKRVSILPVVCEALKTQKSNQTFNDETQRLA